MARKKNVEKIKVYLKKEKINTTKIKKND